MMHTEDIIRIIREVSAGCLTEFSYKEGNMRLCLRKGDAPVEKEAAIAVDTGLSAVKGVIAADADRDEIRAAIEPNGSLSGVGRALEPDSSLSEAGEVAASDRLSEKADSKPREILSSNEEFIQKSPLVGTFYRAPGEQDPPFVQVGDRVTKGQIIGIVEAMKLMNEIECEEDGIVTEILAGNEEPVEYGQPLLRIRK